MILKKGDIAPEISLVDTDNNKFDLKDYRRKQGVGIFLPFCNLFFL